MFLEVVELQHFDGLDAESDKEYERGLQSLCQKWEQYDNNDRGPTYSFILSVVQVLQEQHNKTDDAAVKKKTKWPW